MLTEIVLLKGIYITGTVKELQNRLAEHCVKYKTLNELLNDLSPK